MSNRTPLVGWIALFCGIVALIIAIIAFLREPKTTETTKVTVRETVRDATGETREIEFTPGTPEITPALRNFENSLAATDGKIKELEEKLAALEETLSSVNKNLDYVHGFIKSIDRREHEKTVRSSRSGHEASTIASLRVLSSTQEQYHSRFGSYGMLEDLGKAGYIDPVLASGKRSGYIIRCMAYNDEWFATAIPESVGKQTTRGFYVDQTGVIRFSPDGSEPSQNSNALDE